LILFDLSRIIKQTMTARLGGYLAKSVWIARSAGLIAVQAVSIEDCTHVA
jgi:hypothetical protein